LAFERSAQFQTLAPATQDNYKLHRRLICEQLGELPAEDIDTPLLREYLDTFIDNKPTTGNRRIQYLGSVFTWGYERALCSQIKLPRLLKTKARERYVSDEEYFAILELAEERDALYLAAMMEIIYICRARASEVRNLNWSDISDEGVFIDRGKGSKDERTFGSQVLNTVIMRCTERANPNC
jgi:integrase